MAAAVSESDTEYQSLLGDLDGAGAKEFDESEIKLNYPKLFSKFFSGMTPAHTLSSLNSSLIT